MKRIILDTNILMIPGQFGIDIFEEIDKIIQENYKIVTLDSVIKELEGISKSKSKNAKNAKIGLDLLKIKEIEIIKAKKNNVDQEILDIFGKSTIVATNDTVLRKKLKNRGIKVLCLREKERMEII